MARGDQLARQWIIFQQSMTSRYGKTVNDLAADLDCHPRTVYRDLDALQAAGFPIYNEKIKMLNLTGERFEMPSDFNADEFLKSSFGIFQGQPVTVKLHFSADAAGYGREKTWHESQKIKDRKDGSVILELEVPATGEIKRWIMRWGAQVEVLEPDSLREEIRSEAAEILGVYAGTSRELKKALIA